MVSELVDDRDPDFVRQVVGIGEVLLERQAKERDPARDDRPIRAPFGPRDTFVQPVQGISWFQTVFLSGRAWARRR